MCGARGWGARDLGDFVESDGGGVGLDAHLVKDAWVGTPGSGHDIMPG